LEGEVNRRSRDYIRWIQRSLNEILGLRLAVDGISGPQTRSAIRSFQQRQRLVVDGIVGPQTEAALIAAGASPPPGSANAPVPVPPPGGAVDWTRVPKDDRMVYVMRRLVEIYGYPVNGAAGLVGNLWSESGLLPSRLEGSSSTTPMRASDFNGRVTDFTADQIMNRSSQRRQGPKLPGVGLAQWTSSGRRAGLFQHSYGGRPAGAGILFDMDGQIDYLVNELNGPYRRVNDVLTDPGTTLEAACDEVVYSFEIPGSVLGPADPATGRRQRLPRNNSSVQAVFAVRRTNARRALDVYRQAVGGT
jgi:peptidoglycan hydrolase-like protein with peptidoglycan-binding domain